MYKIIDLVGIWFFCGLVFTLLLYFAKAILGNKQETQDQIISNTNRISKVEQQVEKLNKNNN